MSLALLKDLCDGCETQQTQVECGNGYFVGRRLNRQESGAARTLQALSSDSFQSGMFSVVDGSMDGAIIERRELGKALVKGRSNGLLSFLDCARDPQNFEGKTSLRTVKTEMLYIHRDICTRKQIGADTTGTGRYFTNGDLLSTISRNDALLQDLHMYDANEMVKAFDGHALMGNWQGENSVDVASLSGNYKNAFPNLDGALKQILLQKESLYFSSVTVQVTGLGSPAKVFVECAGKQMGSYDTVVEVITAINQLRDDITGDKFYSASIVGADTVRIVSNRPTYGAYGLKGIRLRYSADGTYSQCGDWLDCTVEENKMPWSETPFTRDYSFKVTKDNAYDYWTDIVCDLQKHTANIEDQYNYDRRTDWVVAIDPLMNNILDFAKLKEIATIENAELFLNGSESMFPTFVPTRSLLGTGIWSATVPGNFEIHTNTMGQLNNIETWYDPNCRMIKSDNEMIMGVHVNDFNLTATNACNSTFHTAVKEAPIYAPINIPHLCPDVRTDCCNEDRDAGQNVLRALATVSYTAAADWDYTLTSVSTETPDDPIVGASTAWELSFTDGTTAALTGTGDTLTLAGISQAQQDIMSFVKMTVTTASGATDVTFVPATEFTETT